LTQHNGSRRPESVCSIILQQHESATRAPQ